MAYAALLSLTQTLEQILHSHDQSRILHEEKQIKSLYEKLSFLLSFLEDSTHKYSETFTSLEGRIRDATYKAEDIIESNMSKRIRDAKYKAEDMIGEKNYPPAFLQSKRSMDNLEQKYEGLQKVIEELDSISKDVEKMKDIEDLQPSMPDGSSKSRSSNSSTMVEFDDDLMQITELPSKLEINSVVEMEGIANKKNIPRHETTSWNKVRDNRGQIREEALCKGFDILDSECQHNLKLKKALAKMFNLITTPYNKMKSYKLKLIFSKFETLQQPHAHR
ncbi:NBS-LRR class resistance protein Fy8-Ry8 [Forsythia ovata]|uniref:NBS-LRR class resistance protein Fy8-Ry8 n=1 Tax=Forsythia ovata TaxID=205694 RepID=A0ABD1WTT1_9LAMI